MEAHASSNRITVGCIGLGGRGANVTYEWLCAPERLLPVRMAVFGGLVTARKERVLPLVLGALRGPDPRLWPRGLGVVRGELPGTRATVATAGKPGALKDPERLVRLIAALAYRNDPAARPAIEALSQGPGGPGASGQPPPFP